MYWSGLAASFAAVARTPGAVVLLYHSIASPVEASWIDPVNSMPVEAFERQMEFLSRHRRVVSMSELVAAMEARRPVAPGTVAITFDDGYLDNLRNAAPILRTLRLPATLYIPTGMVDREEAQWVDRLYVLLTHRTVHSVELWGRGRNDLRDPRRLAAFKLAATQRLLVADRETRETLLEELRQRLEPAGEPPRLTMSWAEVAEWAHTPGLDVGAHTMEHIDLTSCTPEAAAGEIRGSMQRINDVLGRRPAHFSFPYGRSSVETRERVRDAGFRSAVASGSDLRTRSEGQAGWISRVTAPRSPTLFRFMTSAAYPDLPLRLFGRT